MDTPQGSTKPGTISRPDDPAFERLRDERDRFLAFAFCAADLLIELDASGAISFASGATGDYLGRPAARLVGKPFIDEIAACDRAVAQRCLSQAADGRRFEDVAVSFRRPDGKQVPAALTGFTVAALAGRCFLSVRRRPSDPAAPAAAEVVDGETEEQAAMLRRMMSNRSFDIAFQPIVRLYDGRVHHVEALFRFRPEDRGLSPREVGRLAERTGVAPELELAVVGRVVERLLDVGAKGTPVSVAVNLAAKSIVQPAFVTALEQLLRGRRSLPWLLMFEINGLGRIGDPKAANEVIQRLRCLGYKVTLDDFGTSGAAFEQLRDLEVDYVKIAGNHVKAALADAKGRAFITAMAGLCRELGIATIADEIEDERTVAFLRGCGIEYGQGHLYGLPSGDIDLLSGRSMKDRRWRRAADGESLLE
jgi:EAL domain-containing protein (putative c-di-GMP-specific phosphodiesterase class I)